MRTTQQGTTKVSTLGNSQAGAHNAHQVVGVMSPAGQAELVGGKVVSVLTVATPASLAVNGLVAGTAVRLTRNDTGELLYQATENQGSIQFVTSYLGQINIEARKADASPFCKPWYGSTNLAKGNQAVTALQILEE
ncbi:MAG: hypothetical protein HY306_06015 [Nitrosomonadales bacterium]|nr:hypothetical protein [Nitrosomonadales bacterium]